MQGPGPYGYDEPVGQCGWDPAHGSMDMENPNSVDCSQPPSDVPGGSRRIVIKRKNVSDGPPGRNLSHLSQSGHSGRRGSSAFHNRLARNGSVFHGSRGRDTQRSMSRRGSVRVEKVEELHVYYGDMARRQATRKADGLQIVKSFRGDITDGSDVGKPRRVTENRNVGGTSATGYGGLQHKRDVALRNGEEWGGEGMMKDGEALNEANQMQPYQHQPYQHYPSEDEYMQQMMMQHMMEQEAAMLAAQEMAMMDQPVVPQVFQKMDVRMSSDLHSAFSDDASDDSSDRP